jgi:hypothetical protein
MTFKNKKEFDYLTEDIGKDKVFIKSNKKKSIYNLHDIDFTTGYLHKYMKDAYIENLKDLISNKRI